MAVVEKTISKAIQLMQEDLRQLDNQADAMVVSADKLAKIIADAIKSAEVIGVATTVTTAGSATAQTGTGVQSNKGKLQ